MAVGKSTIIMSLCNQPSIFLKPTINIDIIEKTIKIKGKGKKHAHRLEIWDTCGMERFNCLTKGFYKGATHVIFVFDVTKKFPKKYFDKAIETTLSLSHIKKDQIIVIGNKIDLDPKMENVNTKYINNVVRMNKIKNLIFCSAKTGFAIDSLLCEMLDICEKIKESSVINLDKKGSSLSTNYNCCKV